MIKFLKNLFLSIYITFFVVVGLAFLFENQPLVLQFLYTGILTASGLLFYVILETTIFKRKT